MKGTFLLWLWMLPLKQSNGFTLRVLTHNTRSITTIVSSTSTSTSTHPTTRSIPLQQLCADPNCNNNLKRNTCMRRGVLQTLISFSSVFISDREAQAAKFVEGDSTSSSYSKPQEFIDVGTQAPSPNDGEPPFVDLANGVRVKDFRRGSGDDTVEAGSIVQVQCSGKLLNLNGVSFYNTKNNNPDGFGAVPLTINIGRGEALPGLESGIIGMRKGGIRRIIVPADLAYSKYPDLEPKPMNSNDQRALDSVVKNPRRDATILFDVSLERFK